MFLPGESQGRGSLVGYRLWGHRDGHDSRDFAAAAAAGVAQKLWNNEGALQQDRTGFQSQLSLFISYVILGQSLTSVSHSFLK